MDTPDALVIGAGPAGLMAAEFLAEAGHSVLIADAMPSPARKFLMAGKSGLNLTKDEPLPEFLSHYHPQAPQLIAAVSDFGPQKVIAWAKGLGQDVFTGSTGRVFPVAMKASPLLRAWLAQLEAKGVRLTRRWRWTCWDGEAAVFATPESETRIATKVTILALGGASWARLGSDGRWAALFEGQTAPFAPANMGQIVDWAPQMAQYFGTPVKGAALIAGDLSSRGEFVVSARGLEGGGVYSVSRAVREGAPLLIDLFPDKSPEQLRITLSRPRGKATLAKHLRQTLGLDPIRWALLNEFGRPLPDDLTPLLKALPVRHSGPRPMDEAISTAGGLRFDALDEGLMLKERPGVFAAGEMLDWEAPTGGYLLTGCLATGRMAGLAAAKRLQTP
jgi:uncharacterized flavoprotein (TIGR03862 family)